MTYCDLQTIALFFFAAPTFVWLFAYFAPLALVKLSRTQNLKTKYKATWALVTGGSTGIGRAICDELAEQGLNVVIVALDDDHLLQTTQQLSKQYPAQQFRRVPVKFVLEQDYMSEIIRQTADLDVAIIFNNAGYIVTGFFDTQPIEKQLANMECNTTAAVRITHHFASLLLQKNLKGCIVFTSSASGYFPNPFAVMYGATKAFLSQFAASIAVELRSKGIDVLCVHPSPVSSNFYNNVQHKIDAMENFKKHAVAPSHLPRKICAAIGRVPFRDIGFVAITMRVVSAVLPYSFLTFVIALCSSFLPDYKNNDVNRGGGVKAKK